MEKTISLNNEYETVKLSNKESMEKHTQKYAFMHIGLVQAAVKPLTRKGLNIGVLLCLTDGRHLNFQYFFFRNARIVFVRRTHLFNYHPNNSLSLYDPTLNMH